MKSDSNFMEAFNPDVNLVKEFQYWLILLREGQNTLGDCIFVLKLDMNFDYLFRSSYMPV